jgi:hypothetical protein
MKLMAAVLLLVSSSAVFAQSRKDEAAIIQAALVYSTDTMYPYVTQWVVSSTTEALEPGWRQFWSDAARADYVSRNASAIELAGITLPREAIIASLSEFGEGPRFNWEAFGKQYPADTYTMRVSRPGFSDESHAVIRIDVWCRAHMEHPPGITVVLDLQRTDGRWRCVKAQLPAVESGR